MEKFEKLIVWVVPLAILQALAYSAARALVGSLMGGQSVASTGILSFLTPNQITILVSAVPPLVDGLVKVAIAVWLFRYVRAQSGRSWLWGAFGLLFGFWAIITYFLAVIYFERRQTV